MTYYDYLESPIGQLLVVANESSLTGLYMENHKRGPSLNANCEHNPPRFDSVRQEIAAYFEGRLRTFNLPLSLEGTDFQKSVWEQLKAIPFGQTVTYGSIAKNLGLPNAARAVGAAVGANPISIIVPCHRVVGSTGSITGYAGGIDRKRALLDLEQGRLF